ncbi:MAG: twin-arginine translocase TatA/TatE family subunit [Acidobacteriota bacterium]|nr:twin-arginine translocase TatA/TatE family subunit [Acidobacteriota bacterium]
MFGTIGGLELLVIFILGLLVFGPRKLPELGRAIGRSLAEFRRATQDLKDSIEKEVDLKEADLRDDLKSVNIPRTSPSPRASEPPTLSLPSSDDTPKKS